MLKNMYHFRFEYTNSSYLCLFLFDSIALVQFHFTLYAEQTEKNIVVKHYLLFHTSTINVYLNVNCTLTFESY